MSLGPAELAGLEHKGRIEIGADADLVALADDETFAVTEDLIKSPASDHAVPRQRTCAGWSGPGGCAGSELTDDMVAGRLLTQDVLAGTVS